MEGRGFPVIFEGGGFGGKAREAITPVATGKAARAKVLFEGAAGAHACSPAEQHGPTLEIAALGLSFNRCRGIPAALVLTAAVVKAKSATHSPVSLAKRRSIVSRCPPKKQATDLTPQLAASPSDHEQGNT